jgi:hypothetical protein
MTQLIDYAHPCMMAENALKNLHLATLDKDYSAAILFGVAALTEVRLTVQNLKLMKEQEDALRNQAQTI